MIEDNEDNRKMIESMSEGSDVDMEQTLQNYRTACRDVLGWDQEQVGMMERGLRWAVEARRKKRGEKKRQQEQEEQRRQVRLEQSRQGKQVRFGDEEQFEETRAESTDDQKVTDGLAEVRTGRGSAGLVRRGGERCQADETNRKGKGKVNGGKGEHEGKGRSGSKGRQQVENSVMDEDQENITAMTSEEKEKKHKEDVRKLVEMVQKEEMELEMMQQEEMEHEEQRGRVAPNMGAGGSHLQAMSVPVRRETQKLRWADCQDCEDDEGKEEGEELETERERQEEAEGEKEQEQEKEKRQETGQEDLTSEKPPGLVVNLESEHKVNDSARRREAARRKRERKRRESRRRVRKRGERKKCERSRGERRKREKRRRGRRKREKNEGERRMRKKKGELRKSKREKRRLRRSEKKKEKLRPRKGTMEKKR